MQDLEMITDIPSEHDGKREGLLYRTTETSCILAEERSSCRRLIYESCD